jgi:hypothetical protein
MGINSFDRFPKYFKADVMEYMEYEIIYQLDAIEYLFVFFHVDMFRAYTLIFRSNGCYSFFAYAAYVKKL